MAAYAQGCARLWGCAVPATTATPIVKVVFDVLAEQKKEAQMGASQALLKVCSALWGTSEMLAAAAAVCVVAHSNCLWIGVVTEPCRLQYHDLPRGLEV